MYTLTGMGPLSLLCWATVEHSETLNLGPFARMERRFIEVRSDLC